MLIFTSSYTFVDLVWRTPPIPADPLRSSLASTRGATGAGFIVRPYNGLVHAAGRLRDRGQTTSMLLRDEELPEVCQLHPTS
ncbi:hypothetical protein B0H16DRAFT_1726686 [Mycena metata]|uniref:Uncharacterized protein n=1 Tax=Mycena metata TaxID=1033252 RepID=A0AAD7ILX1_9AGAR|nr:hypothetical protein B0H16DRAFT_1726686 [Mycena metata]